MLCGAGTRSRSQRGRPDARRPGYARGGVLDFDAPPHFQPVILNPTTGAVVSGGDFWGNFGEKKK